MSTLAIAPSLPIVAPLPEQRPPLSPCTDLPTPPPPAPPRDAVYPAGAPAKASATFHSEEQMCTLGAERGACDDGVVGEPPVRPYLAARLTVVTPVPSAPSPTLGIDACSLSSEATA